MRHKKTRAWGEKKILQRNIVTHGEAMEVDVAIEEMSELIKELIKNRRGWNNAVCIAEEISHVELMIQQLKLVFDCEKLAKKEKRKALKRIAASCERMERTR